MIKNQNTTKDTLPKHQLQLFGYKSYFETFVKLFNNQELPHILLLSGLKGSGKSTFIYHFTNYILSANEESKYSLSNFIINKENLDYKHLISNTHPNFFSIENYEKDSVIKIDQVRALLKFISKSTYSRDLKIIMIDDAEFLNKNSSNALLKALEEPSSNTFFFLIHDSSYKILDTIRSRCIEYKIFFSSDEKKGIFKNLMEQKNLNLDADEISDNFFFESPGIVFKYYLKYVESGRNGHKNNLESTLFFLDEYKKEKTNENFYLMRLFIEKYYNELFLNNNKDLSKYFFNYSNILNLLSNMKKFNLDEQNILFYINNVLENEKK